PENQDIRRQLLRTALEAHQYRVTLAAYSTTVGITRQNDPEIEADLAEAHQQLGEFSEAAAMFNFAASREQDDKRSNDLRARANQAQAANNKVVENERRRPAMRADLDQPNPVRRRLP